MSGRPNMDQDKCSICEEDLEGDTITDPTTDQAICVDCYMDLASDDIFPDDGDRLYDQWKDDQMDGHADYKAYDEQKEDKLDAEHM
jgi:hypothetical protein